MDNALAMRAAWDALNVLARPVSAEAALETADAVLGPMGLNNHFRVWWATNANAVLARLNG